MGQGYFRNQDDGISDPELIAARYLIGRSAFFEVQLTLAEFADANTSAGGGVDGNPNLIQSIGLESPLGGGCPALEQYVWIQCGNCALPVTAQEVFDRFKRGEEVRLYNPISTAFNRLVFCEILENQPLIEMVTERGVKSIVSHSHKVIQNTGDLFGQTIRYYPTGAEVLSCEYPNIFSDTLIAKQSAGNGDVLKISLDAEFIYMTGKTANGAIASHNRKVPDETL